MSQVSQITIDNVAFGTFRSNLNDTLSALNTTQSGTSRPSSAVAGTIWLDTTTAASPTLKYYDGADDISLATLDHSANTVNWLDSAVSVAGLTTTATGTVLTLQDTNIEVSGGSTQGGEIRFKEDSDTGSNYTALKAGNPSSNVTFTLPIADGTSGQAITTNGSGVLSFADSGGFSVSDITGATALAEQPAATDEIVLSDAGTLKRLDIKHIQNTPAFQAFNSSVQTISNATNTILTMGSELFDSDSAYNTSNYRFTPAVSGKYYLYATTRSASNTSYVNSIIKIKKNGSDILFTNIKNEEKESVKVFGIVDSDADDYFHVEYYQDSGGNVNLEGGNTKTYFGGFRIAGV